MAGYGNALVSKKQKATVIRAGNARTTAAHTNRLPATAAFFRSRHATEQVCILVLLGSLLPLITPAYANPTMLSIRCCHHYTTKPSIVNNFRRVRLLTTPLGLW